MIAALLMVLFTVCDGYYHQHMPSHHHHQHHDTDGELTEIFAWKQLSYNINGVEYNSDNDSEGKKQHDGLKVNESEKFFIQYNNVPIGFDKYEDKLIITVPRRRYGIPSTLNFVSLTSSSSPSLRPFPESRDLVSVYRPRVDRCHRLWMVDTGLLEVPGARKQIQPPAIVVYNLMNNKRILRYELKPSDLVDERSAAGLTSITVDVDPHSCEEAYAYINDLATNGIVVFSLKDLDSWRLEDPSFVHDDKATNFTVAGHIINWKDGIFSIALSDPDHHGRRLAYFHPLVSTEEFSIDTEYLKNKGRFDGSKIKHLGYRGPNTQSGSHGYHSGTGVMFYANVAQDAILCYNTRKQLTPDNVGIVAQSSSKLVYSSDLKVIGDEVWVLVNQIPRFIYSTPDKEQDNFFIHRGSVYNLIRGTVCA